MKILKRLPTNHKWLMDIIQRFKKKLGPKYKMTIYELSDTLTIHFEGDGEILEYKIIKTGKVEK